MDEVRKKIILILALIRSIIAVGTAGYIGIEGWNFIDSLYMTVITL